jgi:hypothetical protein
MIASGMVISILSLETWHDGRRVLKLDCEWVNLAVRCAMGTAAVVHLVQTRSLAGPR